MKLFSTLPLALFVGNALAECAEGTFNGSLDFSRMKKGGPCALKSEGVYYCGDSGTTIVHKQSQLMFRAGKVDSTVVVNCAQTPDGAFNYYYLYHCSANESARFKEPFCKGAISSIESIKEF
ncbi:hypothetical protein E4U35_002489 [Claviceps purpurea]|nr:hypothetical protein E4U38_006012 [Claviceps purpurea]KAG6151508.1 hypothetical protein E4U37_004818 [Claviceps purpurea]KAG6155709.1 hypothetical protein E4U11_005983 [Claviceps purpurea]KAG6169183.1 hypothetical protein E4U51_001675 [Claviceps purpurea]KAG6178145.1 hypothetical protein E4U36_006682 [Claviceps purpurea]